jgi:hypothetical protein
MATALLRVRYCLLGGIYVVPTFSEIEGSGPTALGLLQPGDWVLIGPAAAASVDIGSSGGLTEGV